jgi:YVTN family beta-propeller protein
VVDAKRRSILWSIELPNDGKVVTVSSEGRRAFVSHPQNDRISVINLSKRKLENTVNVGKQPDGVAWVDRGIK